jgi:predicted kinase
MKQSITKESVHENASFKAAVIVGGPGSGKSYMASKLYSVPRGASFGESGLKVINSDVPFEYLLKKNNIDADLTKLTPEEEERIIGKSPSSLRSTAQRIRDFQFSHHMKEGTGIMLDSTGENMDGVTRRIKSLQTHGYDVSVIFIDTPLEVALERNKNRDRKLPDDLVRAIHGVVRRNMEAFDPEELGVEFHTINNGAGTDADKVAADQIGRVIRQTVYSPLKNPKGREILRQRGTSSPTTSIKNKLATPRKSRQSNSPTSANYDQVMDLPVKNPQTGQTIKVKTAMSYGKSHPAYQVAMGIVRQHLGNRTNETYKTKIHAGYESHDREKIKEAISLLEKNTPTSPDKWEKAKAAAKRKFDVYPSAYANLWAAKKYKEMGGGWKKGKK